MIFPVIILIPFYSLNYKASGNILTSNANNVAYSLFLLDGFSANKHFIDFNTSSLDTAPTDI